MEDTIEKRERLALRNKVESEKHLKVYGGLREVGMKAYLHGPMDFAKTLKLGFRVGDLNLPEEERGINTRIPVAGRRRKQMHRCARVAIQ